jgi:hypothetical protein
MIRSITELLFVLLLSSRFLLFDYCEFCLEVPEGPQPGRSTFVCLSSQKNRGDHRVRKVAVFTMGSLVPNNWVSPNKRGKGRANAR